MDGLVSAGRDTTPLTHSENQILRQQRVFLASQLFRRRHARLTCACANATEI